MSRKKTPADPIAGLAGDLYAAETNRKPIEPLTDIYPAINLQDAYRIQRLNIDRRIQSGDRIIGHKIGLTARAMQIKFGVDEPDYGHLLESMLVDEHAHLNLNELIEPQIEVEPAFVLGSSLSGPGITLDDVLAAADYVCVCFEVIDSRISDWRIRLEDTVADNGSSARVVLGNEKHDPKSISLDNLKTTLELDGQLVESGNTGDILGHPGNGVAWLANSIAQFGVSLEAGQIVLPGTCIRSRRISGHKKAKGQIAGLGEVSLSLAHSTLAT